MAARLHGEVAHGGKLSMGEDSKHEGAWCFTRNSLRLIPIVSNFTDLRVHERCTERRSRFRAEEGLV